MTSCWQETETIAAIATAPGRGGIGVVRISGPLSRAIGDFMLRLRSPLRAGHARYGHLLDRAEVTGDESQVLDEVVATFFEGPHSYTGLDVLEIAAHGAPVVLGAILQTALHAGARLAEPGEFTQQAFRSGRLDLTQAEAVGELIAATTLHQARVSANQLGGAISRIVAPIKQELLALIAVLEAGIDFAEDDLEVMSEADICDRITRISQSLHPLTLSYKYGCTLRDGFNLAIVGQPNVGKSSLFNALLGQDRAIVTAIPGTTRDLLTEQISIAGIPVQLTDTAGLRETSDEIEVLGVARSRNALAEAHVILLVTDATRDPQPDELALVADNQRKALLVAANKTDLLQPGGAERARRLREQFGAALVLVSARSGSGLPELRERLHQVAVGDLPGQDTVVLTNLRQYETLRRSEDALGKAACAVEQSIPHEMVLLDLHTALSALDGLTGVTTADDVLERIFSAFCIGK